MKPLLRLVVAMVLALAAPAPVSAAEFREGETVTVASGETINDDLYAAGGTIQVLGTVNGDLVAPGAREESPATGGNDGACVRPHV